MWQRKDVNKLCLSHIVMPLPTTHTHTQKTSPFYPPSGQYFMSLTCILQFYCCILPPQWASVKQCTCFKYLRPQKSAKVNHILWLMSVEENLLHKSQPRDTRCALWGVIQTTVSVCWWLLGFVMSSSPGSFALLPDFTYKSRMSDCVILEGKLDFLFLLSA